MAKKPTTQEKIPISSIHDDLVELRDGSFALVLQTSAVNFDLLSEREQLAIIDAFAGLLNSLSFAIQIVIRSKRLDITNYLRTLAIAQTKLKNPLLVQMMEQYRGFISNTIRENEVLDKQFYVVVLVSYLELGILKSKQKNIDRALTILIPRRDHLLRQFSRIGLKATQLDTLKLIKLFFDLYNESDEPTPLTAHELEILRQQDAKASTKPVAPQAPTVNPPKPTPTNAAPVKIAAPPTSNLAVPPKNLPPVQAMAQPPRPPVVNPNPNLSRPATPNHQPFVVEELPDDYGQAR